MKPFSPILTHRLRLRFCTKRDIPVVCTLAGEKEIAATTLTIPHPYTEEDARRWIVGSKQLFKQDVALQLGITLINSGQLIGAIGLVLNRTHENAELGYWIGKPFWGRGYASEAAKAMVNYGFEELGLNRIHAHHFASNPASGKVLLNCGMRYEGQLPQHVKKWDTFQDIEQYGVLRGDFETKAE